jgi:hypothetical protein
VRIIVVGGSLSGLSAAIALARAGHDVRVFERATIQPGGAGLGVDLALLREISGADTRTLAVVRGNRYSSSWYLVRQWLLDVAVQTPGLAIREGIEVTSYTLDGDTVAVQTTSGAQDADGYVDVQVTQRYRLVAYAVPGPDDSLDPGHRQISWAWYDPDRRTLLEECDCIVGNRVIGLEDDRRLVLAGHAWGEDYLRRERA